MLSDDVLLGIFDFYVDEGRETKKDVEEWQVLVHVCRDGEALFSDHHIV